MTKNKNFDILLYLAAAECAEEEVNEFLALDVSAYPITPEIRDQAKKII